MHWRCYPSNLARKLNKGIQIGKEEQKVSLFSDDRTLYIQNSKDSTKNVLELIHKFSKFAGYKVNIQKSIVFLYICKGQSKNKIETTIPLASKRIKYFRINLTKGMQFLYSENYEMLLKEIFKDLNK